MAQLGAIEAGLAGRAAALETLTDREPERPEALANANAIYGLTKGAAHTLGQIIYAHAEFCEDQAR